MRQKATLPTPGKQKQPEEQMTRGINILYGHYVMIIKLTYPI